PGGWGHLTLEGEAVLGGHEEVWVRTREHPIVGEMPARLAVHSFDGFYEEAEHFASLYRRIAAEVVRLGRREEGVLYAVPGHPWVGESTVGQIVALAREEGIPVRIVEGLSFIEPVLAMVEADALDGLQVADATTVAGRYAPPFDGDHPVLVAQIYDRMVASDVKLVLMELYPAEHPVTLVNGAGTEEARMVTMPLYGLDQQSDFSYLSTLWVPPLEQPSSLPHFQNIIAHLRSPEGCPWDQKQDHHTLRASLLEEAYEAADAIDREAMGELRDELGDLLLLITMHAQIASERGDFNLADVVASISQKIVRRHPHVFGTREVSGAEEVVRNWDEIKAEERAGKEERPRDQFEEVAAALPALMRAQKIARRARKQGWQAPDPAAAFDAWQGSPDSDAALGDLLLALAARASEQEQDAEESLRRATARLVAEQRG
ncbi:MAG: MazG family protein, partial [Chloroflexota bacterium]|nr:MazG family protein [Chloroflexota bacterium]